MKQQQHQWLAQPARPLANEIKP